MPENDDNGDDWIKKAAESRKEREAPEKTAAEHAAAEFRAFSAAANAFWKPIRIELLELIKSYNREYGGGVIEVLGSGSSDLGVHFASRSPREATFIAGVNVINGKELFVSSRRVGAPPGANPRREAWPLTTSASGEVTASGLGGDPKTIARALAEEWIKSL